MEDAKQNSDPGIKLNVVEHTVPKKGFSKLSRETKNISRERQAMDLWLVAVVAGAGYVAKANYLKNSSSTRLRESSMESFSFDSFHSHSESHSWNLLQRTWVQNCPLCRFGVCKHSPTDASLDRGITGVTSSSDDKGESIQLQNCRSYVRSYVFEASSELLPEAITGELSSFRRSTAGRKLKNKSGWYIINSLESCLTDPQLYGEQTGLEEYAYASLQSSCTDMARPWTIGSWMIRGSHDFVQEMQLETQNGALVPTRKLTQDTNSGIEQSKRLSRSAGNADGRIYSQGSPSEMLLFCHGITVGIISTIFANKREVAYLNELLKQKENSVRDLHEELKMTDQLTVKELNTESSKCQKTAEHSSCNNASGSGAFSTNQDFDTQTRCDGREPDDEKKGKSEAMSKIEAELEAELERLGLNMKSSNLERMFDLVEMDSNFEKDVQESNKFYRQADDLFDSDHDANGTSTVPKDTAYCAVSPVELSLRLHEVIQSRLRARIMELEVALENSQKRLHFSGSDSTFPQRDLYTEVKSPSAEEGLNFTEEGSKKH